MKRLALIIALLFCGSVNAATYRIYIDPAATSHGWTHEQVVEGIKLGCANWSTRAG